VKSQYLIFEHGGMEAVVVFSPFLLHQDMAGRRKIKSAGYCELDNNGNWIPCGESVSLNCKPRPQDGEILNHHLSGNVLVVS
jgi:hypothetical protein